MKRIHFVKLLLVAVLALSSTFDVYGESPYVGTFPKSGTISNNSYTLGDVTWGISTTSGTGSPSITFGTSYSNNCIKFGSGAKNCYGSVTLSTDYFSTNSLVVKSVKINAIGSATKDVTMEIGSSTTTVSVNGTSWTNIELTGLNVSSTALSMVFKLNGAGFFINSITITYESSGSGETTNYTVHWMVGGAEYTTTSVKSGSKATPPTTPPADNALSCANTFMGWSKQNLGSGTGQGAPSDLFKDESPDAITENTIFYAVFATDPTK